MSAILMDGKALAGRIYGALSARVEALKARGITPGLAVILAGDDPASAIYVRNKARACERIGIASRVIRLPDDISQEALIEEVEKLNRDDAMHGLLVQLPLPGHIDEEAVLKRVAAGKDVDGFHLENAGALLTGAPGTLACTPSGVIELLKDAGVKLAGARAVVVGRSNIVGKPTALLLLRENATVTVCHSRTVDLKSITREADVLVAAIGRAGFITRDMVKPGAAVVDVGMNRLPGGELAGDVDFESVREVAGWITPVPGGVGPMTIAMLIRNTVEAAER
ncbi:MAG: bifunctional methylenetetrahydrofolate dehydrogenase/methenyltetrahydrofolate cyclohydrolase FolD [Eubacteriales bacterium]|nr:bifunctional methylenetetrahydrofolate dehydrogenase/methenyltetrahydrofolate cyclohydrolase FolD [Christensenellaceae bacterium]MEA5066575.1 bifunctional methylenetetrahydrofolate dehydrogenase/methenyltetrahydrofolate cyclohydrolase FolD [Eubacteriales bacterium]